MNGSFTFVNDAFVPSASAHLHVSDLAIQRGYGIFDFLRIARGRPVFLGDHMERFYRSAERMRLPIRHGPERLRAILFELIERNSLPESGIRINVTGGDSPDGYSIGTPNIVITQRALPPAGELLARGLKLITHAHRRQIPDVKTLDYLMAIWLQPVIKERGADDVLYQLDGVVTECPRANFFIATQDQRLVTAAEHALRGVVRKHVLELAPSLGFKGVEGVVTLEDIGNAKEAFITSTTKGPIAVVEVDGRKIGDGRPGPIARQLHEAFEKMVEADIARFDKG